MTKEKIATKVPRQEATLRKEILVGLSVHVPPWQENSKRKKTEIDKCQSLLTF